MKAPACKGSMSHIIASPRRDYAIESDAGSCKAAKGEQRSLWKFLLSSSHPRAGQASEYDLVYLIRLSRSYQTMAVTRGCSSGAVWLLTFFWEATFVHLLVVDLTPLALAKRCRRGHGGVRGRSRALGGAGCESCCLRATSHSRETRLPSTGQGCSNSLSAHELWAAASWHAGLPSVALLHSSCKTPCRKQPCVMVGIASCTLAPPWKSMGRLFVYCKRGCSVAHSRQDAPLLGFLETFGILPAPAQPPR